LAAASLDRRRTRTEGRALPALPAHAARAPALGLGPRLAGVVLPWPARVRRQWAMRAEVGDRRRPLGRLASARPHAKLSTVNGCCTPSGYDELFGAKQAQKDARRYRKKGLHAPARWIVDSVRSRGIEGATVVEPGGGVGAIQLELL